MEHLPVLKLCTFEVMTPLGRCRRLGVALDGRVMDLNFATAWYMEQTGEAEAQRFADGIVPDNMLDFLRFGLRASHTAEDLFHGAGPRPPDWWKLDDPPRGINGETLVYRAGEVRILAPLEGRGIAGPEEEICWQPDSRIGLAGVIGAGGAIAGYTIHSGPALGPVIVPAGRIKNPDDLGVNVRVNGEMRAGPASRTRGAGWLKPAPPLPGDIVRDGIECPGLKAGDVIEVEIAEIGTLRNRIAAVS